MAQQLRLMILFENLRHESENAENDWIAFEMDTLDQMFGPTRFPRRELAPQDDPLQCLRPDEFRYF